MEFNLECYTGEITKINAEAITKLTETIFRAGEKKRKYGITESKSL